MLRTVIGAVCLIAGLSLLAPGTLRLWQFAKSVWAAHDVRLLAEPQASVIMSIAGRPVDGDTILVIIALVGAIFAVAGIRILRWIAVAANQTG